MKNGKVYRREGSNPSAYTKFKKLFDFYKKFCYNIYTKRKLIKKIKK